MSFYLGIDGGGTKTKFLLGDEEKVLAEAIAAGSNILRSGEADVRSALQAGIEEVCSTAKVPAAEIVRVVGGIAGSSNEKVRAALEAIVHERISCEISIVGDMVIAHHAALEGKAGVLVNSGTGSIAYGRNDAGETARAGGWGFAISDEGSGHWIGRVAVSAAMRSYDAKKNQDYLHHLIAAVGAQDAVELAKFANSTANPDFAQVFPAVLSLANHGDETAKKILKHAGEELACLAETVLSRIFGGVEQVAIAASGGVFRSAALVFERFCQGLQEHHPKATFALSTADPAMGALMLARAAALKTSTS